MPSLRAKVISTSDFLHAATLLALVPISLFIPVSRWPQCCQAYARFASRFRIAKLSDTAAKLAGFHAHKAIGADPGSGYRQCIEMMFEARLQMVDQNLFKRWRPQIPVTGKHHIDSALAYGRGAILWISPFAFSDLVVKIGLAQAGYSMAHLSRPQHGFSDSVLGMALLNRVRTRVEDRFLDKRVRIDAETEKRAIHSLRRIIKSNGIVTITVGSQTKYPHTVSLGHGELPISAGAIRLAHMTDAPLIPVFGVKTAKMAYRVHIESPINADDSDAESTLRRYADTLIEYIDRYPYQCRGLSKFSTRK